jgi:uncharacterized Zn-finger protein
LYGLKVHQQIHTREIFDCSHCKKSFSNSISLKAHHKRIHKEDKEFGCSDCGKFFPFSSSLKAHQRSHTGEKSFSRSGHRTAHNIDRKLPEKNHGNLYEWENVNVAAKINKDQSPSVTSVISELDEIIDRILEDKCKPD